MPSRTQPAFANKDISTPTAQVHALKYVGMASVTRTSAMMAIWRITTGAITTAKGNLPLTASQSKSKGQNVRAGLH